MGKNDTREVYDLKEKLVDARTRIRNLENCVNLLWDKVFGRGVPMDVAQSIVTRKASKHLESYTGSSASRTSSSKSVTRSLSNEKKSANERKDKIVKTRKRKNPIKHQETASSHSHSHSSRSPSKSSLKSGKSPSRKHLRVQFHLERNNERKKSSSLSPGATRLSAHSSRSRGTKITNNSRISDLKKKDGLWLKVKGDKKKKRVPASDSGTKLRSQSRSSSRGSRKKIKVGSKRRSASRSSSRKRTTTIKKESKKIEETFDGEDDINSEDHEN